MYTMKRFFTVSEDEASKVLIILRNAVTTSATSSAYDWLKKQLQEKQITHNDQDAKHPNELPLKRGYASFYVDGNGNWLMENH